MHAPTCLPGQRHRMQHAMTWQISRPTAKSSSQYCQLGEPNSSASAALPPVLHERCVRSPAIHRVCGWQGHAPDPALCRLELCLLPSAVVPLRRPCSAVQHALAAAPMQACSVPTATGLAAACGAGRLAVRICAHLRERPWSVEVPRLRRAGTSGSKAHHGEAVPAFQLLVANACAADQFWPGRQCMRRTRPGADLLGRSGSHPPARPAERRWRRRRRTAGWRTP